MVREGLSEYTYLLILMKLCPGDCKNRLDWMSMKVDEGTGKYLGMVNGWAWKVWSFSINEFWNDIG